MASHLQQHRKRDRVNVRTSELSFAYVLDVAHAGRDDLAVEAVGSEDAHDLRDKADARRWDRGVVVRSEVVDPSHEWTDICGADLRAEQRLFRGHDERRIDRDPPASEFGDRLQTLEVRLSVLGAGVGRNLDHGVGGDAMKAVVEARGLSGHLLCTEACDLKADWAGNEAADLLEMGLDVDVVSRLDGLSDYRRIGG